MKDNKLIIFAAGVFALLMLSLLCGCRQTRYIPVETVRTEYRDVDSTAMYARLLKMFESRVDKDVRVDSLIDRMKETVILHESGDTARYVSERIVYRASLRERDLEVENKVLRDSVSRLNTRLESIKTDSVGTIVPVERELSKWEKVKMDFGGIAIGAGGMLTVLLCIAVIWLIRKRK